jgi:hypothetical protein
MTIAKSGHDRKIHGTQSLFQRKELCPYFPDRVPGFRQPENARVLYGQAQDSDEKEKKLLRDIDLF